MSETYNTEAEKIVLGSLLIECQTALPILQEHLEPDMFYFLRHRQVYQSVLDLVESGISVDPVTVGNRLEEKGSLVEIGGRAYLSELLSSVTTTTSVEHYAQIIRKRWFLRELGLTGQEIAELAANTEQDVSEIADEAEHRLTSLTEKIVTGVSGDTASAVENRFAELERIRSSGEQPGYSTGFSDLDKYGGFQPEELIILAARPSMGKTALSVNMAKDMAKNGYRVLFFSAEMSRKQLIDRFLSNEARIDLHKLRFGKVSDEEWGRVERAEQSLREMPLEIVEATGMDAMTLRGIARRRQMEDGLDLVVVDYLTLISGGQRFERREKEVGHVANVFQGMAQNLQAPVLCLAQLSRSLEHREDKRPNLSDLRESGEIEQAAHVVWFLYRESYYDKDRNEEDRVKPTQTEVLIAKNRNGPTGKATLMFHPVWAGFESYTPF